MQHSQETYDDIAAPASRFIEQVLVWEDRELWSRALRRGLAGEMSVVRCQALRNELPPGAERSRVHVFDLGPELGEPACRQIRRLAQDRSHVLCLAAVRPADGESACACVSSACAWFGINFGRCPPSVG